MLKANTDKPAQKPAPPMPPRPSGPEIVIKGA